MSCFASLFWENCPFMVKLQYTVYLKISGDWNASRSVPFFADNVSSGWASQGGHLRSHKVTTLGRGTLIIATNQGTLPPSPFMSPVVLPNILIMSIIRDKILLSKGEVYRFVAANSSFLLLGWWRTRVCLLQTDLSSSNGLGFAFPPKLSHRTTPSSTGSQKRNKTKWMKGRYAKKCEGKQWTRSAKAYTGLPDFLFL